MTGPNSPLVVLPLLKADTDSLKFAFLRLGKHYNVNESISFTLAICYISTAREQENLNLVKKKSTFKHWINFLHKLQTWKGPDMS